MKLNPDTQPVDQRKAMKMNLLLSVLPHSRVLMPTLISAVAVAVAFTGVGVAHAQSPSGSTSATNAPATNSAAAAKPGKPALTVKLVKAQTATLPLIVNLNGNVAAWQEMAVGSELSGVRLQEVIAQVGDRVRKGQVLAQHTTETIELDLALAQAALAEAQAAAAEAARNADAVRALTDTGAVSGLQVNQVLTQELTTRARVQSAQAQVDLQRLRLKQAQVLAPDDGVVTQRSAVAGAVPMGGQDLFRLIRKGRLEWRGELTAQELNRIRPGMGIALTAPDGRTVMAKVRAVAPTVDLASRLGLVYADLPDGTPLLAGTYLRGRVTLGQSAAQLLPEAAVVQRDGFRYVFVLAADGQTVRQVKVDTGRREGQQVEILGGLDEGAQVVSTGAGFLADGDTVRIAP